MSNLPNPADGGRLLGSRTISAGTLAVTVVFAVAITGVITVVVMSAMVSYGPPDARMERPVVSGGRGGDELAAMMLLGGALSGREIPALGPSTFGSSALPPNWLKSVFLVLVFAILAFKFDRVQNTRQLRLAGLLLALSLFLPSFLVFICGMLGGEWARFLLFTVVLDVGLFAASVYMGILSLIPLARSTAPDRSL